MLFLIVNLLKKNALISASRGLVLPPQAFIELDVFDNHVLDGQVIRALSLALATLRTILLAFHGTSHIAPGEEPVKRPQLP